MIASESRLQRRIGLLFVSDQFDQTTPQFFAGDLDEVALTSFKERALATDQFTHSLLQQSSQAERTADLLD